MPSKRTKVHPGPFNGGEPSGEAKGDGEEDSRHSGLDTPAGSEPSSADEAGRLLDFAVSMVSAANVAVASPRPAAGEAVGEDGLGQAEETGAKAEADTGEREGETDADAAAAADDDDGSDSSSKDTADKLFDYAVSMAAASTIATPRPQIEAGGGDGPKEEHEKLRELEDPEEEGGSKERGGGDEPQQEEDGSLRGGAGKLVDDAVSMEAESTPAAIPPSPESDAERKVGKGGDEEGVREQEGAKEDSQTGEGEVEEPQQEEDDEPLGWLFDFAVSQAGVPKA